LARREYRYTFPLDIVEDAMQYDVVVVGAGPTGLSLATELKRLGLSALVLDRLAEGANTSRAAVVHARTLEVLESSGATSELLARGLKVPTFCIRDGDKVLLSISFDGLDTKYPFALMCSQEQTEAILLRRLTSFGGTVQRPCEVFTLTQVDGGVRVDFQEDGQVNTATGEWAVGCDGSHSLVRKEAGIPFEGSAYEERFVLGDVEMEWPLSRDEVSLFVSQKGLVVVAPLPENRFRIVATAQEASAEASISFLQTVLDERGPGGKHSKILSCSWASKFHIEHRVARSLRSGNILIAGDAAHVHSPAGGQGMNTGIQDAVSLAQALVQQKSGQDTGALDKWEAKRMEIARDVVSLTDKMTKFATLSSPIGQLLRNAVIGLVGYSSAARHKIAEKLAELDNR
jgi:2-polyprenyl-6-methoxyphenol hydroxylase-like FAD-dependent oxidoreductase